MLVLASASPRRRELLGLITKDFTVCPAGCDESLPDGIDPESAVLTLAERKARDAAGHFADGDTIIGSDTIVVIDGEILGKPRDESAAVEMLRRLSGRTHTVYTGLAVLHGGVIRTAAAAAEVTFADMTDAEIADYVATGEPLDKAGAYGIQGRAARYISGIRGDWYAVVGLPVHTLYEMLKEWSVGSD